MSYHTTGSKLDRAIVAYLISAAADCPNIGTAADIFPVNSQGHLTYPVTVVASRRSSPNPNLTGNHRWDVAVTIKGSAIQDASVANPEQMRVALDARVSATGDALMMGYPMVDGDGNPIGPATDLRATADLITAAGRALAVPADNSPAAQQKAANNADMADFTCESWIDAGCQRGSPDESGSDFIEALLFQADAVPVNIS